MHQLVAVAALVQLIGHGDHVALGVHHGPGLDDQILIRQGLAILAQLLGQILMRGIGRVIGIEAFLVEGTGIVVLAEQDVTHRDLRFPCG